MLANRVKTNRKKFGGFKKALRLSGNQRQPFAPSRWGGQLKNWSSGIISFAF